jgi:release factor glutamine methyltransferase
MPADARTLIRAAAATLSGATPRLDAELLLAHVLGESRADMLVRNPPVAADAAAHFDRLLTRRRTHEPVAYILERQEFWSLDLWVTPDVLIPRPDSETVIEAAIAHLKGHPPARILDLGTGSGALLLAALSEWPGAFGVGVDRSAAAIDVARGNAGRHGFSGRAGFVVGDWAAALGGRFDLILCNPPYVEDAADLMPDVAQFEPASALYAGADGLADYRRLLPEMPRLLGDGGVALFEFGTGQAAALTAMGQALGFTATVTHDLGGRPRVLALVRVPSYGLGKGGASG